MYTQCPECSTAFRVTANVLRQAAGKVRCGGCRHAFNALDYLSETMPELSPAPEHEERLPELTPEPPPRSSGVLPESISAAQSAALLKTLDQLAGSNIRIEDTGVEWRVLDDDELGESPVDELDAAPVDELLEDTPTPVDQYLEDAPGEVDAAEIFEAEANGPASTPVEELRFDDNTPLPENFGFAEDGEPPAPRPTVERAVVESMTDEPQTDLELADPDEWEDLLGEVDSLLETVEAAASRATSAFTDDEEATGNLDIDAIDAGDFGDAIGDGSIDELLDVDTQFALQAEAMGIEVSGRRRVNLNLDDQVPEDEFDLDETILDEDLSLEEEDDDRPLRPRSANFELDLDGPDEADIQAPFGDDPDTLIAEFDENIEEEPFEGESDIDQGDIEVALDDETGSAARPARPYVPPMTEEEQTINMMIDQDLLSIAVEDEDGFISTIVMPGEDAAGMVAEEKAKTVARASDTAGFETIIMEGEFVHSELDKEKLEADAAEARALVKQARAREAEAARQGGGRRVGMIAAAVLLALLLVAQVLHFSRDALATNTTFSDVAGPVYRAIGKPLAPAWDIGGWRFEVTRGNADVTANTLTIYSRIGNKSDKPLPYPLIGISLTDRFEEVIGSRVLEPAEYLTDDLDPRRLVRPGNTFNAVMTIRSPAPEATGFKLNVCYRVAGGKLRCAIQDFR